MSRSLLRLSGADVRDFLQDLVTNDVARLDQGAVYAALLTPQGKYIADFFLVADGADVLMDIDTGLVPVVMPRLNMYKLRADVVIEQVDGLHLHRGLGPAPSDGWADPRHDALGWRAWRPQAPQSDTVDWEELRVEHLIPESGIELTPDAYILEHNFEALNGVDFRKGCYVGQEVTARMKHKAERRKGLARVTVSGDADPGMEVQSEGGKAVGRLLSRAGDRALAWLRFDRAEGEMRAGDAIVRMETHAGRSSA